MKLALSIALPPYEHALDLLSGRIAAEGVDLNWVSREAVSAERLVSREVDVADLSLADFLRLQSQVDAGVVAIPVFTSRLFVPPTLWIKSGGSVSRSLDLAQPTLRVAADDETLALYAADWLHVRRPGTAVDTIAVPVFDSRSLSERLSTGEIDLALSASSLDRPSGGLRRLFGDAEVWPLLRAEYGATGLFPILRVVCVARDLVVRHRWLPASLFQAFDRSKRNSLSRLIGAGMSRYPLPWLNAYVLQARETFGEDLWPYGTAANRVTLDSALASWARRQGAAAPGIDTLFAGEV